jgi:hypothetical protein
VSKLVAKHGRDHQPNGGDPVLTEVWHVVGTTVEATDGGTFQEPPFKNGWGNIGTPYSPTMFRLVVGAPGNLYGQPGNLEKNIQQSLEIVMAVTGGTPGTTIFTLPAGYYDWANGKRVPGHAHDSVGTYKPYYIDGSTGDVVDGV